MKLQDNHVTSPIAAINREEVLNDYLTACISRQLSLTGRKEVHAGRAHFGIFGDGKEVAQIAYAKCFQQGDWRSGYYRDQTFMLASGLLTPEEFFAQIYGDTDIDNNPSTGGRNFNNHYSTANYHAERGWLNLLDKKNSASDISSTAGQMPRLLGLAQASKIVRDHPDLQTFTKGKITGNEVAFGMIGDASTSEGLFFETINAACVLQIPMAIAVWDDGYGISVPVELQTAKGSISQALAGFVGDELGKGCKIFVCEGHNYPKLVKTFEKGIDICRSQHIPVLFHITELTQPLGHSTSGSHERYKSRERLHWEKSNDANKKFREWLLSTDLASEAELDEIENQASERVRLARELAWNSFTENYHREQERFLDLVNQIIEEGVNVPEDLLEEIRRLSTVSFPTKKGMMRLAHRLFLELTYQGSDKSVYAKLNNWIQEIEHTGLKKYDTDNFNAGSEETIRKNIPPRYDDESHWVPGAELLNKNFHHLFAANPLLVTFGEDTGKLGDVNQGMKGLQEKFGEHRVSDAGIREATIIGQGIGLALRGFRPIAEIQYLDYLIYALPTISDDLGTLHYRTKGQMVAPLIIRTRGHQLQGMWHSGSPMGMLLGSLNGIFLCVPRNMTQAAGMYNTLLKVDNPALVIEPLKGYHVRERVPANIGAYCVPLGSPEILRQGTDITVVTYGWNVTLALEASAKLAELRISVELIDLQTLIPFDTDHILINSLKKTNKLLVIDEDFPGGASAYILQKIIEEQGGYYHLDAAPKTLSAKNHRSAYGIDGEYFSKPNQESIIDAVYQIMHEVAPGSYPKYL